MKLKSILSLFVVAVAAVSLAQGGGGGRGQGRGGFGGGMGMMQGGPGGGGSMTSLLNRPDVQKELALTSAQIAKIEELNPRRGGPGGQGGVRQGGGGQGGGRGQGGGGVRGQGGQGMDRDEMMKRMQEREKSILAVLDEKQQTRLKELFIQRAGNAALMNPEIQKDLGFTNEQKSKVEELQRKQQEASMAIMEKMRNGEIQREELGELMQKNGRTMNEELGKILTKEQAEKFESMKGKKFEFSENN
jgi:hypothetical protein